MKTENKILSSNLSNIENRITRNINQVVERGIDNIEEKYDDFFNLIEKKEYKRSLIIEIYENYFPPRRHEFELELITELVEAIISSKIAIFTAGAVASSVIGNTTSFVTKTILNKIISCFKKSPTEQSKFRIIKENIVKIEKYFQDVEEVEINLLSKEINIEKEKLIPLLKLLGFKRYNNKGKKYWVKQ